MTNDKLTRVLGWASTGPGAPVGLEGDHRSAPVRACDRRGYGIFRHQHDNCEKVVLTP